MTSQDNFAVRFAKHKDELEWLFMELYHNREGLEVLEREMAEAYNARSAELKALDNGVLAALEAEGERVLRAPLSEALWFLWKDNLDDNKPSAGWLDQMQRQMQTLGNELGAHSAFAEDAETLFLIADSALPNFSGGNGRYRYAKAVELSGRTNAVLTLAPRYENTAMILDMRGLHDACRAPLFQLSLDNDWDETAWSRLRSFLYYC